MAKKHLKFTEDVLLQAQQAKKEAEEELHDLVRNYAEMR